MRERLATAIDRVVKAAAIAAAWLIAALFLLGLAEIILRTGFGYSLPISLEYSGYLVALAFFWGSGWMLNEGGHIRVRLFETYLSRSARKKLDAALTLIGLGASLYLSVALFDWALGSALRGSRSFFASATLLALPQFLLGLGAFGLTLAFLSRALRLGQGRT